MTGRAQPRESRLGHPRLEPSTRRRYKGDERMIDLTLKTAETALKAAQAKANALGSPMTVTVVDEAGRLVLSARGDGTGSSRRRPHAPRRRPRRRSGAARPS